MINAEKCLRVLSRSTRKDEKKNNSPAKKARREFSFATKQEKISTVIFHQHLSHLRHSFAEWCLQKKCDHEISRFIRHIFNLSLGIKSGILMTRHASKAAVSSVILIFEFYGTSERKQPNRFPKNPINNFY